MPESQSVFMPLCSAGLLLLISVIVVASAIRIIPETTRLSVFRLGHYIGEVGPGVVILIPFIDKGIVMDVHDQVTKLYEQTKIWGAVGTTLTEVHHDGSVDLGGEMWNAISQTPIPPGKQVRVVKAILEVKEL